MDSGVDSRVDSGVTSGMDSRADSGMDQGVDSGLDSRADSGVDLVMDPGMDSWVDSRVDSGMGWTRVRTQGWAPVWTRASMSPGPRAHVWGSESIVMMPSRRPADRPQTRL